MTKKILIGLGALAVVIAAGAAWAHGPGGRRFMAKQMITKHVAEAEDYVQATPEQRTKIDAAVNDIVGKLQAQRQDRQNMHQQVMQLLTGPSLTEADIQKIASDHADQLQALAKAIAPDVVTIHDTLTQAQRDKLAARAKELRQKHQHGPQGGFGGPGE